MITALAVHALLTLSAQQVVADSVMAVSRGSRLDVGAGQVAGRVEIRAWDRDEVGVGGSRNFRLTREGGLVRVRPAPTGRGQTTRGQTNRGAITSYVISVPAWMPVTVDGNRATVIIEGITADISVETVNGSIVVRGSEGRVEAHSVQGSVTVETPRGPVEAFSMNADVRVSGASGSVALESVNGNVRITGGQLADVVASSVSGNVDMESTILANGIYRLSSHNGRVRMTVQEGASATVTTSTYTGDLRTTFPISLTERTRSGRSTFLIGTGSARIEASSFNGNIEFRRPGEPAGRGG